MNKPYTLTKKQKEKAFSDVVDGFRDRSFKLNHDGYKEYHIVIKKPFMIYEPIFECIVNMDHLILVAKTKAEALKTAIEHVALYKKDKSVTVRHRVHPTLTKCIHYTYTHHTCNCIQHV